MPHLMVYSDIVDRVRKGLSPPYRPVLQDTPEDTPPSIVTMMTECWEEDPNQRPSFNDCLKKIKNTTKGQLVLITALISLGIKTISNQITFIVFC